MVTLTEEELPQWKRRQQMACIGSRADTSLDHLQKWWELGRTTVVSRVEEGASYVEEHFNTDVVCAGSRLSQKCYWTCVSSCRNCETRARNTTALMPPTSLVPWRKLRILPCTCAQNFCQSETLDRWTIQYMETDAHFHIAETCCCVSVCSALVVEKQPVMTGWPQRPLILKTTVQFAVSVRCGSTEHSVTFHVISAKQKCEASVLLQLWFTAQVPGKPSKIQVASQCQTCFWQVSYINRIF